MILSSNTKHMCLPSQACSVADSEYEPAALLLSSPFLLQVSRKEGGRGEGREGGGKEGRMRRGGK